VISLSFNNIVTKKYEEYAYVIDFIPRGRSIIIRGREGPILQAIGEDRLTLLEILAVEDAEFQVGETICIGKQGRNKVVSVLGRLTYEELTSNAKSDLLNVLEKLVLNNEKRFVDYFNEFQAVTPRLHALELIPGVGKTFMLQIIKERDRKKFSSFSDIHERSRLSDPAKLIAKRIVEEITENLHINLFVK